MSALLLLATLAVTTPAAAPITVEFTNDSVYRQENIISAKDVIKEEDTELYTIVLEKDNLLGYTVYDSKETDYIDGLKFDKAFVKNWTVEHVDLSKKHTVTIKTVYTDDVAGILASAKDGDWSKLLANPLVLLQLFYYTLAAFSLILGGFGLLKARKNKAKTSDEISKAVFSQSEISAECFKNYALNVLTEMVSPLCIELKSQNQSIIQALILAQSKDPASKLALIDLLKTAAAKDVNLISENISKSIKELDFKKEQAKAKIEDAVKQIASGNIDNDEGGISI